MKAVLALPIAALIAVGGCVSEKCYENWQCTSPQICGPGGECVFECSHPADCSAGFTCENHLCVTKSGDTGPDAVQPILYCPAGMVLVNDLFCIDVYEATRPDSTASKPGSDESRAVTRKGAYPWMTKDNTVAAAACLASDKRLCEPSEWKLACSGPDGQVYSYGDEYEAAACNGIDAFGRSSFHLMPTGSFPECTNEFGVFDMNGNVWEHVAGGDGTDVRGGAYNCSDSAAFHKCSYVPGSWTPAALGFRCCRDPLVQDPVVVEVVEVAGDVIEPSDAYAADIFDVTAFDVVAFDFQAGDACVGPDFAAGDVAAPDVAGSDVTVVDVPVADAVTDAPVDAAHTDVASDAVSAGCPADMALVSYPAKTPFCMDRYEASRSDSTSTIAGVSMTPVSESGRMPWYSSSLTTDMAAAACQRAGKRLCALSEWFDACSGSAGGVYVYGSEFDAAVCNSIDTFCDCDGVCAGVAECPYPHCRTTASAAGDGGPCGASFHVTPTGSFPSCVNEWGVFDVNGNVWEVVEAGDNLDHFRGGAYNCSDSEALHRCDNDATWGPSAKGFRCCMDAVASAGD